MSRIAFVNGKYMPLHRAQVNMQDRGYQFADGIYEVVTLWNGWLVNEEPHLERMQQSLETLDIPMPMSVAAIRLRIRELIRLNRKRNGLVYMQVTRGVANRNHVYGYMEPVFTMALLPAKFPTEEEKTNGAHVITVEDQRWKRCDVKAIALLPNMLARMEAYHNDAKEAWQINQDGFVTEGSLSNAYIVTKDGAIQTHPANEAILGGVRRQVVLELAKANGIKVIEKPFALDDVKKASEAFMTSASQFVLAISSVDDMTIGEGKAGPITQKLADLYEQQIYEGECVI